MKLTPFLLTAALALCASPAMASKPGEQPATGNAMASTFGTKSSLSAAERGRIAKDLVRRFQVDVKANGGDVQAWASKLGRAVGLGDAANVQRAAAMPTLNTAMAVLRGQPVDSPSIQAALKEVRSGQIGPAALGDPLADTVYTPLPNGRCRVADSRVINNPLPGGAYRLINVDDVASYSAQGGSGTEASGDGSTNCGLINDAAAFAVSVTTISTGTSGIFKIFMTGAPTYKSGNTLFYNTGQSNASDLIVKSCTTCTSELEIYSSSNVEYIIDVIGYFSRPAATNLDCVYTSTKTSAVIPPNTGVDLVGDACPAGTVATSVSCWSNRWQTSFPVMMAEGFDGVPRCGAYNFGTHRDTTASIRARCCRVPGR